MILWWIVTSGFWALIITVVLWLLCALVGKLINPSFRPTVVHHLICLIVAVPTVILLTMVFMLHKADRLVTKGETYAASILANNSQFVNQLQQQINQAVSTSDTENLSEYLTENYSKSITAEYPLAGKYIDTETVSKRMNLKEQLSGISKGASVGQVQQFIQATATGFTSGIHSKIKSIRRKSVIAVLLLQAVAFGILIYQAGNYRRPAPRSANRFDFDNSL